MRSDTRAKVRTFNRYCDYLHDATVRFDFVLANSSFNKAFLGFQR